MFITSRTAKAVFVMLGQGNIFYSIDDCFITELSILISRTTSFTFSVAKAMFHRSSFWPSEEAYSRMRLFPILSSKDHRKLKTIAANISFQFRRAGILVPLQSLSDPALFRSPDVRFGSDKAPVSLLLRKFQGTRKAAKSSFTQCPDCGWKKTFFLKVLKGWIAFLGPWKGKTSCNSQKVAHGSYFEEEL